MAKMPETERRNQGVTHRIGGLKPLRVYSELERRGVEMAGAIAACLLL